MKLRSALLLGLLVPALAHAASPAAPVWVVALCQSPPGQAKEDFLRSVAVTASAWTQQTGLEACGVLGRQGKDRWSLVLSTNRSQVQCLFVDHLLLPGATHSGDQFHTHPSAGPDGVVEVLPSTHAHAAHMEDKRLLGVSRVRLHDPGRLSRTDLEVGGGYLASAGRLSYQGPADVSPRDLGVLPTTASACVLRR